MKQLVCVDNSKAIAPLIFKNARYQVELEDNLTSLANKPESSYFAMVYHLIDMEYQQISQLRQLKEQKPELPIILVTSHYYENVAFWCLRNRIWDYIVLPAETDYFNKKLRDLSIITRDVRQHARSPMFPTSTSDLDSLIQYAQNSGLQTQTAVNYIHQHFAKKLDVKILARLCGMPVWKYTQIFKTETGQTTSQYIKSYRIKIGKEKLITTNLRVQQIAYAIGFNDVSHFNRVFREFEGITPIEYRNLFLKR